MSSDERLMPVRLPINNSLDVVTARRRALEMALALGFLLPEATKIAVVVSELARNILLYAQTGTVTLMANTNEPKSVKIVAQDRGPGIPDVDLVLKGGYSTSKGLGVGLSGSKRIMDEFEIQSLVDVGTMITAVKWLR
jgi:serine/threonine-protein kinase RsbT